MIIMSVSIFECLLCASVCSAWANCFDSYNLPCIRYYIIPILQRRKPRQQYELTCLQLLS